MGSVGRRSSGSAGGRPINIKPDNLTEALNQIANSEYTAFDYSRAIDGGWDYSDTQITADFFRENSDAYELMAEMTPKEKDAFKAWAAGRFMHGEQYLPFDQMPRDYQKWTKVYDKYFDKAELKTGITVRRRSTFQLVNNGSSSSLSVDQLKAMEGQEIFCKSSLATGAASEGLTGMGTGAKPVEYVIHAPKGKGWGMWIGDRQINPYWGSKQAEFVTNRDMVYQIGKSKLRSDGVTEIELTMVRRQEHDYGSKRRKKQ